MTSKPFDLMGPNLSPVASRAFPADLIRCSDAVFYFFSSKPIR